ncbi:MAG: insulinase family protein [Desulforhopalus sp.]
MACGYISGEEVCNLQPEFRSFSKRSIICFLIVFFAGTSAFSGVSFSKDSLSSCISTHWPSDLSQLVPDASLVRGKLKNGFRYVVKPNREPENRVAVYLAVQAGSLNENENQRGMAHFLEHMMFNGSKNFPPGSLVDYFQSIGMSFGSDTNAYTSHDQTVYHTILPSGSEDNIDSGFLVMADYARGALLLNNEIERERGVILAEKRARDSAGYRVHEATSAFAFRGTLYPERMPIGVKKTILEADHELLKSFYDAWYRPENMILVVIGDIQTEHTKNLIEKHFSELSSVGPEPQCPDFGELTHQGIEAFYHYEPELGKTHVSIQTFRQLSIENDSIGIQKQELLRILGSMIINYRLQRLQEEEEIPFAGARYYSGDIVNRIGYDSISTQVDADHWKETVTSLDRILRQAISHGFKDSEVERAKKEIIAQLESRVLTADSEDSRVIARRIIDHLKSNRVYQSAEQERALYVPLTQGIQPSEVIRSFQKTWNSDSRLISLTGNVDLGENGTQKVAKTYLNSTQKPVLAATADTQPVFPYLQPDPPEDTSFQSRSIDDIGVERLVFANGLVVNLKQTRFEENKIRIRADFGAGKQNERVPGLALLLEDVINGSGSGKLPRSSVDALLAGSSIKMSFKVGESAFSWTGSTLAKDFDFFIQTLHHLLLDPGLRQNVFSKIKENLELEYQNISQEIEGAMVLAIKPFLAAYNEQFGLPAWDDVAKIDFNVLSKWAQPIIVPQDLEISVVGDFYRDDVIAALTKYFSGIRLLPFEKPGSTSVHFPAGEKLDVKVSTSAEKSMVVIAWPTDDFWSIERTRRLHLLASIFGDRLRKVIREKLAASYSPNVSSFSSRVYQGYGYILSQIVVKPGTEDAVIKEIFKISDELQKEGITAGELNRARGPLLTSLKESIRTNRYWLHSVLSLSARHPQQFEWPTTLLSDYTSINVQEINKLAETYLGNRSAAVARVTPAAITNNENKKVVGKSM